ncbi:hypothetical protein [Streptomyces sp. NPDC059349]|uniref:hypothetical protein n=1 Tax=Streptomyces sp. NPDC059349 TaxID=3346808 RepID=UPI0036BE3810
MTGNLPTRQCAVPFGAMLPLTFVTAACSGWADRPAGHLSRRWPGLDGEPDTLPTSSMTNWPDRCAHGSKTTPSTNGQADSSLGITYSLVVCDGSVQFVLAATPGAFAPNGESAS